MSARVDGVTYSVSGKRTSAGYSASGDDDERVPLRLQAARRDSSDAQLAQP